MNTVSYKASHDCRRAAQYLITILAVLAVGMAISFLPVMTELKIARKLMATDLVVFATKITALILFFKLAEHALAAIAEDGKAGSFVRGIGRPLIILMIVIIGQALLWQVIHPFVGPAGKKIYFAAAILLILAVSIWSIFKAYQSAPYLLEGIQHMHNPFVKAGSASMNRCHACGHRVPKVAKFCSECGEKMVEQAICGQCGATLKPDQKFCWQCGSAVNQATEDFFDGQ